MILLLFLIIILHRINIVNALNNKKILYTNTQKKVLGTAPDKDATRSNVTMIQILFLPIKKAHRSEP